MRDVFVLAGIFQEAAMELLRIFETPVAIRVIMALCLAMMLAIVVGLF